MSGSRRSLWQLTIFASWLTYAQALAQPDFVSLPMNDGVALATDVWRASDTPRPVLLRRTPYGRAFEAQEWLDEGYVVVSQDVRGRGDSAGTFLPFATDEADARTTIDWIAAQPWSNGRVGMIGASAEGIVQYQAIAAAPSALACTSIRFATHDVHSAMLPGGAWRTELDSAWLNMIGAPSVIDVWRGHEARDAFWEPLALSRDELRNARMPVFIVGGFFDIFAPDQARIAHELPQHAQDVTVVLGPWTHGSFEPQQGELRYPDDAALASLDDEQRAFFSACLRGAPAPALPKVRYYLTELGERGGDDDLFAVRGEWRASETWPPRDVHVETWAFDPDQSALSLNPSDPVPTRGGGNFSEPAGPFSQAEIDRRADVYLATTEPLAETLELVGTPRAFVWAASATDDIDVVVRFEQVTPRGEAIAFADGVRRGRFVRGYDTLRALKPGEPTLFEVELGPIALRVNQGAALRVAISGASSPRYEPNPNRALPLLKSAAPVATTLTLFIDPEHPSRIELPVLRGTLPRAKPRWRWVWPSGAALLAGAVSLALLRLRRRT
jgi:uncharacterized protein